MNTAFQSKENREAVLGYYDNMMGMLRIPYERLEIGTRYGHTSLIAAGDAHKPPLILLHGSSMNAAMWIGDIPKYTQDFRVYAPDLPGEPGRSDERQLPFDTDDYANWLHEIMNMLHIDVVSLCGASLGGWLATKFASLHPDRVAKLALLCPAGIGGQNHAFKEIAMRLLPQGEAGVNELFRQINGGDEIPEVMLSYQKLIAFCFNARQEPIPLFTDEELMRLAMSGSVFLGGQDIMLNSNETAARVRRLLPHFEVVELPTLGHSLAGQGASVLEFLAK